MLPSAFPRWELVCCYFQKWSRDGTLEEIHAVLRNKLRRKRGLKESPPRVGLIDSQSIKTSRVGGECRGIDVMEGKRKNVSESTPLAFYIEPKNFRRIAVFPLPFNEIQLSLPL